MAYTLQQRLMSLGVPTLLAGELMKQIDSGVYSWQRLMWSGMVQDLALYVAKSMDSGAFSATKATEYGMIPAVATLIKGAGVQSLSSLVQPGDLGAFMDYMDAGRLFATYVGGANPATTGDAVGLLADQYSFPTISALSIPTEKLPNFGFDTDLTGWKAGTNQTQTWDTGRAKIDRPSGGQSTSDAHGPTTPPVVVNGEMLKAMYGFTGSSIGRNFSGMNGLGSAAKNAGQHIEVASATASSVGWNIWTALAGTSYVDNESLRSYLANLTEQHVPSQRPTFGIDEDGDFYIEGDGVSRLLRTDMLAGASMTVLLALRFPSDGTGQIFGGPSVGLRMGANGEPAITFGSYDGTQSSGDIREEKIVLGMVCTPTSVKFMVEDQIMFSYSGSYTGTNVTPLAFFARASAYSGATPASWDRFCNARLYGYEIVTNRAMSDADAATAARILRARCFPDGAGVAPGLAPLSGVNLAGAEFPSGASWPDVLDVDYFAGKGAS